VRFPLVGEDAALVVWTTTPWTLSSNMFAAVNGDLDYAYVRDAETGERLVIAEGLRAALAEKLGRALEVERVVKGSALVGKRYVPPFDTYQRKVGDDPRYFRVVPGDKASGGPPQWFVTLDAGTGIVHCAPAFGEDDWKVWRNQGREHPGLEMFCAVRPDGKFSRGRGSRTATRRSSGCSRRAGASSTPRPTATSTRSAGAPRTIRSSSTRARRGSSRRPR
jgi:isoleucyl-tRNA synthetase